MTRNPIAFSQQSRSSFVYTYTIVLIVHTKVLMFPKNQCIFKVLNNEDIKVFQVINLSHLITRDEFIYLATDLYIVLYKR